MRKRKVINLYDDEPAHADLLAYLEGIEGDNRRQQALVQMVLVGFRVMVRHESGDEAFFRTRNPDISRLIGQGDATQPSRAGRAAKPIQPKEVSGEVIKPKTTKVVEKRHDGSPLTVNEPITPAIQSGPVEPYREVITSEQRNKSNTDNNNNDESGVKDPLAMLKMFSGD